MKKMIPALLLFVLSLFAISGVQASVVPAAKHTATDGVVLAPPSGHFELICVYNPETGEYEIVCIWVEDDDTKDTRKG